MLAFPNAKINLGLNITSRRPDGYHTIESCLYPIPWRDVLEAVPAKAFKFDQTGLIIPGDNSNNLCVKAYELIKEDKGIDPVHIHLHKVIPMGAGLGGGSADGAFTLKLLNAIYQLEYSVEKLQELASLLGSDCPFFIENKPAMATGTGTTLSPYDLSLKGAWIALKHPSIHVSTKEAYSGVTPRLPNASIAKLLKTPIEAWKGSVHNDFEESVFAGHPEIKSIKEDLYNKGASFAAMSGSGSAVFGVFTAVPKLEGFQVFEMR
ncbi:MAG: 4-(cytidine 5'-diphospho)-2-C-methyl-D-erythritol kinase [Cyclobacteriaceae bacterium]